MTKGIDIMERTTKNSTPYEIYVKEKSKAPTFMRYFIEIACNHGAYGKISLTEYFMIVNVLFYSVLFLTSCVS